MSITIFDGIVIVVVLISALLATMRGFMREMLSIASWIAAAVVAIYFYPLLLPYITPYITIEILAIALAIAAIFLVTLIVVSFITMRISDFVLDSVAGPIDRMFGFLFGALRGLLIIIIAFTIFTFLVQKENQPNWITEAKSLPALTNISNRIRAALPDNLIEQITEFLGDNLPSDSDSGNDTVEIPEEETPPTPDPVEEEPDINNIIEDTNTGVDSNDNADTGTNDAPEDSSSQN